MSDPKLIAQRQKPWWMNSVLADNEDFLWKSSPRLGHSATPHGQKAHRERYQDE